MLSTYEENGLRFQYPSGWEIDESDDDERTTITVQSASGPAFLMITLDEDRPDPSEMVEEALAVMREEYPSVEARPASEVIAGIRADGFDLEFFSLDMLSECQIRAFRTPTRTILVFAQWSSADLDDDEPERIAKALRTSLQETDG